MNSSSLSMNNGIWKHVIAACRVVVRVNRLHGVCGVVRNNYSGQRVKKFHWCNNPIGLTLKCVRAEHSRA